jgi:hypothetical protein
VQFAAQQLAHHRGAVQQLIGEDLEAAGRSRLSAILART